MSLDFARAWQIAKRFPMEKHASLCSYRQSKGGVLCDCDILMDHQETKDKRNFYTKDGVILKMKGKE